MAYNSAYTGPEIDAAVGAVKQKESAWDEAAAKADSALQSFTEADPTVPDWAKRPTKPAYTASEVGALPDTTPIPTNLSDLSGDNTHRVVTDVEKAAWNAKADKPKAVAVTLTAAGWDATTKTQTVSVPGILANETKQLIQPMPAAASQAAYIEAGIRCIAQGANTLTFTADTVPTENFTVYVTITEVNFVSGQTPEVEK